MINLVESAIKLASEISPADGGGEECLWAGHCIEGWPAVVWAGILGFTLFGSGAVFLARTGRRAESDTC